MRGVVSVPDFPCGGRYSWNEVFYAVVSGWKPLEPWLSRDKRLG